MTELTETSISKINKDRTHNESGFSYDPAVPLQSAAPESLFSLASLDSFPKGEAKFSPSHFAPLLALTQALRDSSLSEGTEIEAQDKSMDGIAAVHEIFIT